MVFAAYCFPWSSSTIVFKVQWFLLWVQYHEFNENFELLHWVAVMMAVPVERHQLNPCYFKLRLSRRKEALDLFSSIQPPFSGWSTGNRPAFCPLTLSAISAFPLGAANGLSLSNPALIKASVLQVNITKTWTVADRTGRSRMISGAKSIENSPETFRNTSSPRCNCDAFLGISNILSFQIDQNGKFE